MTQKLVDQYSTGLAAGTKARNASVGGSNEGRDSRIGIAGELWRSDQERWAAYRGVGPYKALSGSPWYPGT